MFIQWWLLGSSDRCHCALDLLVDDRAARLALPIQYQRAATTTSALSASSPFGSISIDTLSKPIRSRNTAAAAPPPLASKVTSTFVRQPSSSAAVAQLSFYSIQRVLCVHSSSSPSFVRVSTLCDPLLANSIHRMNTFVKALFQWLSLLTVGFASIIRDCSLWVTQQHRHQIKQQYHLIVFISQSLALNEISVLIGYMKRSTHNTRNIGNKCESNVCNRDPTFVGTLSSVDERHTPES